MTKIALLVLDQQKKSQWNYEFGNEIEQHSQQDSDFEFNYYIQKEDCLDKFPMKTVIRDNAKCGNCMKS